jgi:uncharacterized protein (TIGR02246 family)
MLSFLALAAFAQLQPTASHPTNVDFSDGEIGQIPSGWHMDQSVLAAGFRAEMRRDGCDGFVTCVTLQPSVPIPGAKGAALAQTFPAAPYRGKWIRFSAWLRVQDPAQGYVHVRMRFDYPNGRRAEIFDSAVSPVISPEWQRRDVYAYVYPTAESISIWTRFEPGGSAWVAAPSFSVVNDGWNKENELAVRALIKKFADARNAHYGPTVAALYSEDGEWLSRGGRGIARGREALTTLWGGVTGQVHRTIESVDFPGDSIALVHVALQYEEPTSRHHETFVLVQEKGTWYIHIHQTVD